MFKNKKIIAVIAIIGLLSALILYTLISQGFFFGKGTKLKAEGSKTYISPGKLLYSHGSTNGAWVVYLKTGQTIISYMDNHGNKQWQQVYAEPKIKVNSSLNYTIVGESEDKVVRVLNIDGTEILEWDANGNPLLCNINDDGLTAVVSDAVSKSGSSWATNLTLSELYEDNRSNYKLKEIFSKDFNETEFIEVNYWKNGVVALVYKVNKEEKGQYVLILDNDGQELFSKKVSEAVSKLAISPNGELLTWASDNTVYKYNSNTQKLTEINYKNVISCGFVTDTKMYMVSNQTGLIPFGRRVHLSETNLAGKSILKANFPGYFVNDQVLSDGTLAITSNKGIYAISKSKGVWYAELDKDIFTSAIDSSSIITITKDDTLTWYERP